MGHVRLGRLPATRKWQQVVSLLARGAPLGQIAGASAEAAENSLEHARRDPALLQAFWLLTQIPLAARSPDFSGNLQRLGLSISGSPSLMETVSAFSDAIDRHVERRGGRTDLGEMAQNAAAEVLQRWPAPIFQAYLARHRKTCASLSANSPLLTNSQPSRVISLRG